MKALKLYTQPIPSYSRTNLSPTSSARITSSLPHEVYLVPRAFLHLARLHLISAGGCTNAGRSKTRKRLGARFVRAVLRGAVFELFGFSRNGLRYYLPSTAFLYHDFLCDMAPYRGIVPSSHLPNGEINDPTPPRPYTQQHHFGAPPRLSLSDGEGLKPSFCPPVLHLAASQSRVEERANR